MSRKVTVELEEAIYTKLEQLARAHGHSVDEELLQMVHAQTGDGEAEPIVTEEDEAERQQRIKELWDRLKAGLGPCSDADYTSRNIDEFLYGPSGPR